MLFASHRVLGWFVCVCAIFLSGCGDGAAPAAGKKRLILLTNGNSPFWDAANAGINDAKKDLNLEAAGFDALMEYNDGTIGGQIEKLRQYLSQTDIAGIGISAINAKNSGVAEILQEFQKKGVAVVTIDSDIDREKYRDARTAFIGTDNLTGGIVLGECTAKLLPEGGEYATFVGVSGAQNAQERIVGFGQGAGEKFKSADSLSDDFNPTKARENVRNAIRNHPDLKVLVGIYSYNAPAIVDVVKELDRRKDFTISTFDAEPIAVENMSAGMIDVMVVQNPYQMGYQGIRALKAIATKDDATLKEMLPKLGKKDGDIYDTGLKVVVPNTDSPITAADLEGKAEFLTLEQFQAWLKKYNLAGS